MLECPIWSQTYFALSPWAINIDAKKCRVMKADTGETGRDERRWPIAV
jgi:hypothetical protein